MLPQTPCSKKVSFYYFYCVYGNCFGKSLRIQLKKAFSPDSIRTHIHSTSDIYCLLLLFLFSYSASIKHTFFYNFLFSTSNIFFYANKRVFFFFFCFESFMEERWNENVSAQKSRLLFFHLYHVCCCCCCSTTSYEGFN